MKGRYDAIVVGARVSGASTALLLARAGARVALVDRAPYGSDTLSTHGLMRGGVLQLSRWGILDAVVRAGTPAVHRTLFHYAGEDPVQVTIRRTPGVDALYAPRRHLLDRLLVDAAAEAGAEVVHGLHVTGVHSEEGRVHGVHASTRDGRSSTIQGRVVVGADGVRSTIASAVGSPVVRQGRTRGAVLYRYYAHLVTAGYEWAYGDGAAAGLIPTNDGLTCVFVSTRPERMRQQRGRGTEAAFGALLDLAAPGLAGRVRAATPVGRLHGWAGAPGLIRRAAGPGWALVGDAGYFKDPITTHGMTDALRDAELLSEALLAAWGGEATEATTLAAYQRCRDRLSTGLFGVTERVAAYDWGPDEVRPLLRSVSSAMTDEVEVLQSKVGLDAAPVL